MLQLQSEAVSIRLAGFEVLDVSGRTATRLFLTFPLQIDALLSGQFMSGQFPQGLDQVHHGQASSGRLQQLELFVANKDHMQ